MKAQGQVYFSNIWTTAALFHHSEKYLLYVSGQQQRVKGGGQQDVGSNERSFGLLTHPQHFQP